MASDKNLVVERLSKYNNLDPRKGVEIKTTKLTNEMIDLVFEATKWAKENKDVKDVSSLVSAYTKLHEKILMHPQTLMSVIGEMDKDSKEVLLSMLEKDSLLVSFEESAIDREKLFD